MKNEVVLIGGDGTYNPEFIIFADSIKDKEQFLEDAKLAEGSYAAKIFGGVYDNITKYSIDLKDEYSKYYQVEYSDFETFLRKKHHFSRELISELKDGFDSNMVIYFEKSISLLSGDNGLEIINELLFGES